MPRLSLYKPERGQDYKFIDRQISEMFQVGGTDVYLHKYIGTETIDAQGNPVAKDHTQIQDLLLLENRDRKYDPDVYRIRGIYNVQNIDFNMSQFGLFIDNDTVFMTVHINDFIQYIGRKPMSGDVLELPHLRDEFALSTFDVSLPRYYAIEDVGRASEGFSATWYPHLYRLKIRKIAAGQQYADIFRQEVKDVNGDSILNPATNQPTTLEDLLSTKAADLAVNNAILSEAEANAPQSGYQTGQFYTLAVDPLTGKSVINQTADLSTLIDSELVTGTITADDVPSAPVRPGYTGYLLGGNAPNGASFGSGIQFPATATTNDFFLRTDYMPNRLFRFDGTRWVKYEDSVRMTMTNTNNRNTQKTGFINNTNSTVIAGQTVVERQSLSEALKPQADI
jgi:hypothetical protein